MKKLKPRRRPIQSTSPWVGPWRCATCGDAVVKGRPGGPACRCFVAEILGIVLSAYVAGGA
jgi:hypothetical protein